MKSLKDYILEKSNGEVTTVSSIGVKNFATIMDRPERIMVVKRGDGKEQIQLCRVSHEREIEIPLEGDVSLKVGASSGVVIAATSGSTRQISAAIVNQENRDKVFSAFDARNQRARTNIDASLGIINKVAIE